MKLSALTVALAFGLGFAQIAMAQERPGLAHGTLITVMGNKAGIVAMSDSRVTHIDAQGRQKPDLIHPIQKLFKYDDRTVCLVAGALTVPPSMFAKPQDALLRKLDTQVLGLIQFYRGAVKKSGTTQSMADTLDGLSAVIKNDFQILSDLNSSLNPGFDSDYHVEIFLAGRDIDGELKIGRKDIAMKRDKWPDGRLRMMGEELEVDSDCKLHPVADELSVCSGGLNAVETRMRKHPEAYSAIPIMRDFAASLRNDHGASLTIDQLKRLGRAFKKQTLDTRVGGPDQIAVITKERLELDPANFQEEVTIPKPFVLISCPPGGDFPVYSRYPVPHVPWVFQHCDFVPTGVEHPVDGMIYLKCKFRDTTLIYLGGDAVFGPDNLVEGNSFLFLGRDACRRPDIANELARRFDTIHGGSRSVWPGDNGEAKPYCTPQHSPPGTNTTRTPN
jgi:hypothetical protein